MDIDKNLNGQTIKNQLNEEEKPIILAQIKSLIQGWEAPGIQIYDGLMEDRLFLSNLPMLKKVHRK